MGAARGPGDVMEAVRAGMTGAGIQAAIEAAYGALPPYYALAQADPSLLASLWERTRVDFFENPLPPRLKAELAAYLGRYAAAPYCLVCHVAALRRHGFSGADAHQLITTAPFNG